MTFLCISFLLDENLIDTYFWIPIPGHFSYFEKISLQNICNSAGWDQKDIIADFPIDIFLPNPQLNYISDRSKGKDAHKVRVKLDNFFNSVSVGVANEFYRTMAKLGLGRNITWIL